MNNYCFEMHYYDNPSVTSEQKFAIRWIDNDANPYRGRGVVGKDGQPVQTFLDPRSYWKLFSTKKEAEKYIEKRKFSGMTYRLEVFEVEVKM